MIIYAIKNGHYRTYNQPEVPTSVLRQIAITECGSCQIVELPENEPFPQVWYILDDLYREMTDEEKIAAGLITEDGLPVPQIIMNWQARHQLIIDGDFEAVETAINGLEGQEGLIARQKWEYATIVRREDPTFNAIADLLGKTEQQRDTFFREAAKL